MKAQKRTEVAEALGVCRSAFIAAGAFSLFINILLLVPSVYMLQIYDRVLGSRNETTLVVLTLVCVGLLLLNGALGIGAVAGLVIFQLLFVVNVGRVVMSQGIQ